MELRFDIRGYLIPTEVIKLEFDEFKKYFVYSFDEKSRRHKIFKNYTDYLGEFKSEISPKFKQWVNGSFVTNKFNPRDIDLVTLLDYEVAENKINLLNDKFKNNFSLREFRIDAYLVKIYPESHKDYKTTVSDLGYWRSQFGSSRKNRAGKKFQKGFIELEFN